MELIEADDPDGNSWKYLWIPNSEAEIQSLIEKHLRDAVFRRAQVHRVVGVKDYLADVVFYRERGGVVEAKAAEEHRKPLRKSQNDKLNVVNYAHRVIEEKPKITPTELSRKVETYVESSPDWLSRKWGTRTYENWVRRYCDGYAEGQRGRKKKAE